MVVAKLTQKVGLEYLASTSDGTFTTLALPVPSLHKASKLTHLQFKDSTGLEGERDELHRQHAALYTQKRFAKGSCTRPDASLSSVRV